MIHVALVAAVRLTVLLNKPSYLHPRDSDKIHFPLPAYNGNFSSVLGFSFIPCLLRGDPF